MSSKAPPAFPPPGTLKAKLVNLVPRANVLLLRLFRGRVGGRYGDLPVLGPAHGRPQERQGAPVAEEKAACWPRLTAGYSFYDDLQARTTRDIPVIVLTPMAS